MRREERNRLAVLETLLTRFERTEMRTLYDLQRIGYGSFDEAYRALDRARERASFTARQLQIAMESQERRESA